MNKMSDVRKNIEMYLEDGSSKAFEFLQKYITRHEPIEFSDIAELSIPNHIIIRRVKSSTGYIYMKELCKFEHVVDVGYTDVIMTDLNHVKYKDPDKRRKQRKTLLREGRILAKCIRGHFVFQTQELMNAYIKWWLYYLQDMSMIRCKRDWVIIHDENVVHIRGNYFWTSNPSSLPYEVLHGLESKYNQIYCNIPSQLVKLDESALEFLKGMYGESSDQMKSIRYGVMDKSLFDIVISEHIRIHTPDSPSIRKWASNYDIRFGKITSPSLTLSYISTIQPDAVWRSPIYVQDLKNEHDYIMDMVESHDRKYKNQTSIRSKLDSLSTLGKFSPNWLGERL